MKNYDAFVHNTHYRLMKQQLFVILLPAVGYRKVINHSSNANKPAARSFSLMRKETNKTGWNFISIPHPAPKQNPAFVFLSIIFAVFIFFIHCDVMIYLRF